MHYLNFKHGGDIYEIKNEVIDFSANINPLGIPLKVKSAIKKNLNNIIHYPEPLATNLTTKIANLWGISSNNIIWGNGSVELIYLITNYFRPKSVLIPIPTFSEYERAARSVEAKIQFLSLKENDGFRFNDSLCNKADIFFLCHPNNPTGNFIINSVEEIKKLGYKLIVVDEAFMDFLPNQNDYTLIWTTVKEKKIVVLRTFTKMFSMPGLRIGYLVGHKDIVNKLKEHLPPWNINSIAQVAAESILEDKEYVKRSVELVDTERKFLFCKLSETKKLIPYPSITNFLLLKIKDGNLTSTELRRKLIPEGILIRDCVNFRGLNNKFIRIAVRSHKENLKLIKALNKVL